MTQTTHDGTPYAPDLTVHRLLTVNEAAFRLAIGRSSVYRLVQSGALRAVRIGERIRFRPDDLEAYIDREATP